MKLLHRYILQSFGRLFLLALAAFVGIYLLVDFFEKVDDFIEHQARAGHYVAFFSAKIPLIVVQVTPLAMLLATILTLGGLSRTNEVTAMRAGGIGLWRICAPLLGFSLLTAGGLLLASEFIVPLSARTMNTVYEVEVKGKSASTLRRDNLWFRDGKTIVNVALAVPEENALEGVRLFYFDENFHLLRRIDSPKALFMDGSWRLTDVIDRRFHAETGEISGVERKETAALEISRAPADFHAPPSAEEESGFRRLRSTASRLQAAGYDATRYLVDMQARLATPFATVIMAFLGIPFALQRGRGSNLALGVAISVAIGVIYHLMHSMLLAFGYSGVFPPVIAAWSANLIFLLLGILLILSARQ